MGEAAISSVCGIVTCGIVCATLVAVIWMARSFICYSFNLAIAELMVRWAKKNDFQAIERVCTYWGEGETILSEVRAIKARIEKGKSTSE